MEDKLTDADIFAPYLARWNLASDGTSIVTPAARLLPVRRAGKPAMLKVALEAEEAFGGTLLDWWDGEGAARLLASHGDAILIERAEGGRSLSAYAREGRDDEATRILCDVVAVLHAPRPRPLPELVPLSVWFGALWPVANAQGGLIARAADEARALFAEPGEVGPLHGDIHHDNVLDFGPRGWLAIDPKRLLGERGFDYANLFSNPDLTDPSRPVATVPEHFARRLVIAAERPGLDRGRLLRWIIAWSGLSAAWFIGDGLDAGIDLRIAELACAALDG